MDLPVRPLLFSGLLLLAALPACSNSSSSRNHASTAAGSTTEHAFDNVGPLAQARVHHTATRLHDDKILIVGGLVGQTQATATVEIFDPATGQVTSAAPMSTPRMNHQAVLLPTRKVLVVGGQSDRFGAALISTELYDPINDVWARGPDLTIGRSRPQVAAFDSGKKVLIAGGASFAPGNLAVHATADIYNADANTITASTSQMTGPRCCGEALMQSNGQILIVSGYSSIVPAQPASAEVYDPATDQFVPNGLQTPRADAAVALLPDGVHAIAGVDSSQAPLSSAERFDGNLWTSSSSVLTPRSDHTASVRNTDAVLIGGRSGSTVLGDVELYPGGVAVVGSGSTLADARYAHTATRVGDRIYVIGGFTTNDDILASIEVYAPKGSSVPGAGASKGTRVPGAAPTTPITPTPGNVTVALLVPNSGNAGDIVQVSGLGFDPLPANNIVRFNGLQAVVTLVDVSNPNAHTLTCIVPIGATTGPVTVEVNGSVGTGPAFSVGSGSSNPGTAVAPQVIIVAPNSGRRFFPVSITGRNFGSQPVVTFNGVPTINVFAWNSKNLPLIGVVSELVVIVPPGATTGPLIVHNGNNQSAPFHFTVR